MVPLSFLPQTSRWSTCKGNLDVTTIKYSYKILPKFVVAGLLFLIVSSGVLCV
jgi:hypothetical protein